MSLRATFVVAISYKNGQYGQYVFIITSTQSNQHKLMVMGDRITEQCPKMHRIYRHGRSTAYTLLAIRLRRLPAALGLHFLGPKLSLACPVQVCFLIGAAGSAESGLVSA